MPPVLVRYALGEASVEEIDAVNILQATFLAMRRALQGLAEQPDLVLIDGNRVPPELGCRAETIVGGDARSYSIAAASIIAKVTRDRYMCSLAASFPGYGWETNVGYRSPIHLAALNRLGPTTHHRRSFAPVMRFFEPPLPFGTSGSSCPAAWCAGFRADGLHPKKPRRRPRQAEMVAQRRAVVLAAEQAALLQDRHHEIDEIVEAFGEVGRHDVEAIGGALLEPVLQRVGDRLRRAAQHPVAACRRVRL